MNSVDDYIALLTSPRGIGVLSGALGAFLLVLAIGGFVDNRELDEYVQTRGEIVDANLFRDRVRVNGSWTVRDLSTIEYAYVADGREEVGTRVYFGEGSRWGVGNPFVAMGMVRRADSRVPHSSEDEARVLLEEYPIGKQVDVFYHPSGLRPAFLVKEDSMTLGLLVPAVLLLGLCGWMFASGRASTDE